MRVTDGGRAACQVEGARWVNTVRSNVKRALDGTYHAVRFCKYAHRYLGEAAWRFNRRFRLDTLVPRLHQAVVTCPPWAEHQLRAVPVYARANQVQLSIGATLLGLAVEPGAGGPAWPW